MHRHPKPRHSLLPILSLLTFVSLFLILKTLDLTRAPSTTRSPSSSSSSPSSSCNYSDGTWVYDRAFDSRRYDGSCKEIFKGWDCISSGKSNAHDLIKWRWRPHGGGCNLLPFDSVAFLEAHRDTNIGKRKSSARDEYLIRRGFIGDSLNRNMFVSLFCVLKRVSGEVKKWRPAGADRGFTFVKYNLTIAYHRTNLLARYGRWSPSANGGQLESMGYKDGYRVDVDIPEGTWAAAPLFHHILIFNTGHWWWAPSKFNPVKSPMLFFLDGKPIIPPLLPEDGLDLVLKRMIHFVNGEARHGTIKFFRTQSPRHFEGGDWNHGGSCPRSRPLTSEQVEEFFAIKNNGTNVETCLVNNHLYKALEGSGFHILDVTHLSEFRADAHPSTAGGKKHDDCMHWCLPGITDTWNDLFVALLNNLRL